MLLPGMDLDWNGSIFPMTLQFIIECATLVTVQSRALVALGGLAM